MSHVSGAQEASLQWVQEEMESEERQIITMRDKSFKKKYSALKIMIKESSACLLMKKAVDGGGRQWMEECQGSRVERALQVKQGPRISEGKGSRAQVES